MLHVVCKIYFYVLAKIFSVVRKCSAQYRLVLDTEELRFKWEGHGLLIIFFLIKLRPQCDYFI